MQFRRDHRRLLPRGELGRHKDVRRLVGMGAGAPDAPEHLFKVAIGLDQLLEMLLVELQPGAAGEDGDFFTGRGFEWHG
jgi:hypothetical protein